MNERISTSDPRWDGRIESIARKGWALDDLRLRARLSPWDRRRMEQAIIDYRERLEAGEDVGPKRARPEPIATPKKRRRRMRNIGRSGKRPRRWVSQRRN